MKKIKVGVICGGFSNEREVSLMTGEQIAKALPKDKYVSVVVELDKNEKIAPLKLIQDLKKKKIDVAFIGLHGRFGEDGKIQAILETLKIPHTGPGVLSSALGMDKIKCMEFLGKEGIPVPKFVVLNDAKISKPEILKAGKAIGYPCIVKPNESGSSVGVFLVKSEKELPSAVGKAFREDKKVIVQKYIKGREFSCGVMGNDNQKKMVLPVIEIIPRGADFFDYHTKYFSEKTEEVCPAEIRKSISQKIQ